MFAEGIEALFRFAIALMKKSEDRLLGMNFEDAVDFLKTRLFDVYEVRDLSWLLGSSNAECFCPLASPMY